MYVQRVDSPSNDTLVNITCRSIKSYWVTKAHKQNKNELQIKEESQIILRLVVTRRIKQS